MPVFRHRGHLGAVGHEIAGGLDVGKGVLGSLHAHVGAGAEQGDVAFGLVLGGQNAGGGWELVARVHDDEDDGGVDGRDDVLEDGGAREEGEGAVGEFDGVGVIAEVNGELGADDGGRNANLLGDLEARNGCVGADVRTDPVLAILVRGRAVSHQDNMFSCLGDCKFPSFRVDVSLETLDACRQLTERLVYPIRGRNGTRQVVDLSLLRYPQDDERLDTAECEKRPEKAVLAAWVFGTRWLNIDHDLHFRRSLGGPQCAHYLLEMDRGNNQSITLFLVLQGWEHDRHFQDGKFEVAPEIRSTEDWETMILHFLSNPCLIEPDDGPHVLELEDTAGLPIDFLISQKNSDWISHRVCPPGVTPNGPDGYFTWLDRAITASSLTSDFKFMVEV